ncbi:MAG: hypothetical protein MJ231_05690 [bacterium]|nr:hypothetical protein [bacterium]
MKIKQLLPIALFAAMLTPAAMAAGTTGTDSVQHDFTMTISPYINITDLSTNDAVEPTSVATDYTTFTLNKSMSPKFKVVTNVKGDVVYLTAKTANSLPALGGYTSGASGKCVIAFANETYASDIDQSAVTGAITGTDETASPNVIGIQFTFDETKFPVDKTGAHTPAGVADATKGNIAYTIDNGAYNFTYAGATGPWNKSFSTLDENGTYKATITMSHSEI